ncbi:Histidine acid phosphatase family protein [Trichomonas vaginalis G3]|uniref:Histidine acid phosphatase family protein n=1 Tax=Trichomonas vaginalis (strain ATCC PRA-98 / G3) TaxID=412133 RepID=A2EQW2_TRIV3|nr:histidine acid phosphatase [Trichomonas vaginalis G3]EAY04936.1 Histidine acid phosphatase family protein [Trichomonas vaginalis G3]KAI5508780.1 regulation of heparan sulfate proteoglycan biosynthetic process [Trichomonas vaginalis G3]|eukprot:XP_001317159.1 histidine acid phosphatase [Trichomonas vaginalis G3]
MIFFLTGATAFDYSYCAPNYPSYKPNQEADLIQVQLLTRHGARTPLHLSKNYSNHWKCMYDDMRSAGNDFLQPYHVHVSYGSSIFVGNCVYGQLIHTGKAGLAKLGKYLKKIYIDQLKFIPPNLDQETVKFRTTQAHRTINSQISLISGMYPHASNVEMYIADKNYDPWRRTSLLCPKFAKLQKTIPEDNHITNQTLQDKISNILGVGWSSTNDVMTSALCNNYKLPPNITMKDVDDAIELKTKQMQFFYSHSDVFPLFFSFCASEMVNEMLKRMNGDSNTKFIHWSAHDGNILGYLGLLGYTDNKWPPYGSYILTELLRFRSNGTYIVQFRYNGKLLKIPRFKNETFVYFNDFLKFLTSSMPKFLNECDFNTTQFKMSDTFYVSA